VERLSTLDRLGPNARAILFARDGDIDFVLFTREGIAWLPVLHGNLVTRVARRSARDGVAAA
jgi:hypothetical protein